MTVMSGEEICAKRDQLWASIGLINADLLVPLINPAFAGLPQWPDLRQAYRTIKLANGGTIIATDGLSDPFHNSHPKKADTQGFGLELCVMSTPVIENVPSSWIFSLLYQASLQVANHGRFSELLDKYQLLSLELYDTSVPTEFQNEQRVGVMMGLSSRVVPELIQTEAQSIKLVSVMLLTQSELAQAKLSPEDRIEVGKKIIEQYGEPISSLDRKSVI